MGEASRFVSKKGRAAEVVNEGVEDEKGAKLIETLGDGHIEPLQIRLVG